MRIIRFILVCTFICIAQQSVAQAPPSSDQRVDDLTAKEIFAAMDQRNFAKLKPVTLSRVWSVVRKGRPIDELKEGFRTTLKFRDGFGRRTNILIDVPQNPQGILFALHGLGGDRFHLGQGTFDAFAKRNNLILVAPDAQKEPKKQRNEDISQIGDILQHWWSYRPEGFVMHLLASLKRTYSIDPNRVYLVGHSMGAFATWNIGLRYPDRFAALVPMSGGMSRREYLMRKPDSYLRSLLYNALNTNVLFIHGAADKVVPVLHSRRTRDGLRKLGYIFDYVELKDGRHMLDFRESGIMISGIGKWMQSKRRDPHPKRVRHRAIGDYMMQSFWLRLDQARFPNAEVDAQILPGNRIKIECRSVDVLTVFIDEKHLNVKKPIKITVNGMEAFAGVVPINGATVIESWLSREDRNLVYRGKVQIKLADLKKAAKKKAPSKGKKS
ncbi:MAG: putative esterase [Planctomycetota bacterium]|jgi:predicted esterase